MALGHNGSYEVSSITLPIGASDPRRQDPKAFYEEGISTTAAFVKVAFPSGMKNISIENTGAASLEYSFNGVDQHGVVDAGTTIPTQHCYFGAVWLKNGSGATTATVSAYREG